MLTDPDAPTFAQWLKATKDNRKPRRLFLIAVGNHWVVVSGRRFCCGLVKEPTSIRDPRARRRRRVKEAYLVVALDKLPIK